MFNLFKCFPIQHYGFAGFAVHPQVSGLSADLKALAPRCSCQDVCLWQHVPAGQYHLHNQSLPSQYQSVPSSSATSHLPHDPVNPQGKQKG